MKNIEKILGYNFKDKNLLKKSLTHRSYAHEKKTQDNEVLEFLGDSVLSLTISKILIESNSSMSEGQLTKKRHELVCQAGLAKVAKSINLGNYILLGNGEAKNNGSQKDSILADTLEAIVGAIFTDSDFETSLKIVKFLFKIN